MKMKKKQKRKRGDIAKIDLGNSFFAFAQVLESPLMAFFDFRSKVIPPISDIVAKPIAFKLWVMKYAVTDGDWPIVGHAPVNRSINERPPFFKKDSISGKFTITYSGAEEEDAELEDVIDLECAAAWDPEHVVDRLNDHFAGRPNKWVESMRPD